MEKATEQLTKDTLQIKLEDGTDYKEESQELGDYSYENEEEEGPITQADGENEDIAEYKELSSEEQLKFNLASVIRI